MFVESAFHAVCKEAVTTGNGHYVCLMETIPFYGGPEEGGWYGSDLICVAFQYFETGADQAVAAVEKLAAELNAECRKEFGQQCLREMDWLEARGLDADFLPEPDGESTFSVIVADEVPASRYGSRGYS